MKIQVSEEIWRCLVLDVAATHKGVWLLNAGIPRNTGKNVWFWVLLNSRRTSILYLLKAMIIAIRLTRKENHMAASQETQLSEDKQA